MTNSTLIANKDLHQETETETETALPIINTANNNIQKDSITDSIPYANNTQKIDNSNLKQQMQEMNTEINNKIVKNNLYKKTELSHDIVKHLGHIPVELSILLGNKTILLHELADISVGEVIKFNQSINDPVAICVNEKTIAYGKLVLADNEIGIKITELVDDKLDN